MEKGSAALRLSLIHISSHSGCRCMRYNGVIVNTRVIFPRKKPFPPISASGKTFHRHAPEGVPHAEAEPRQHKRQHSIHPSGMPVIKGPDRLPAENKSPQNPPRRPSPVSYTHLDVYKRQDFTHSVPMREGDDVRHRGIIQKTGVHVPDYFIVHHAYFHIVQYGEDCLLYTSRCV